MSEVHRHGRALLEASRRERTPSAEVKQRVLAELLETAAQTSVSAREAAPLAQRLGVRAKALLLVALAVTIGGALWAASR